MKKRLFNLIFVLVLLISSTVLAFSVRKTYAKYSSVSNATLEAGLEYKAHSGGKYTLEDTGDKAKHRKTWSCCGYVEYETHSYDGDTDYECDCGYVRHEHTYTLVSRVESTCTATGTKAHYICDGANGCGKLFDKDTKAEVEASTLVIAMKAHNYTVTAWNDTYHYKKCSNCTAIDESTKVEHSAKDSTWYSDETNHWKVCSCSDTVHVETAAHTATSGGTAEIHTYCSVCNRTLSANHSYTSSVTTSATCTTTGVRTYTCACEYSYTETIAVLGHTYNQKDTSATYLCSAATCTAAAKYYYKCERCSAKGTTTYDYGNANGHKSVYGGTVSVHTKCSVCGATTSSNHSYTTSVAVAATCTVKGTTKYTCACGYSYTAQNIDALGHEFTLNSTTQRTAATCTVAATYWKQCSRCSMLSDASNGNAYYSSGSALGHDWPKTGTIIKDSTTQHRLTCKTCGTTKDVAHTMTHSAASGSTGTVSCSACPYSITPANFIDAQELANLDRGGEFKEVTYANDKDVGRGMWTKFDDDIANQGHYIDVPLNNMQYMVIEYGDMYGVSGDFAAQSYVHVQYFIHGVNILHTAEIQNTLTSGVQGSGLCTEIFDFGTEATAIEGSTSGNYVRMYLWQTTAAMHIKSIAFFNTKAEAMEYQNMLALTSEYPVLDCGDAVIDPIYN